MKIGIYGPALNEIKHIDRWYESCKDADVICIADTGSTDGTKERLIELGVRVTDIRIKPWRFDLAFNVAMSLLPDDVDVCIRLDMDERLQPGWRAALEAAWTPETTRLRYPYIWNWNPDGSPGRRWYGDRIHARSNYYWQGATHEGLVTRTDGDHHTFTDALQIWQFPDAKDKKQDLRLLLEATREYPHDARLMAYLGREYMYQKMPEDSIRVYKKFLGISADRVERGLAMRNLATVDTLNKEYWLKSACLETPGHREPLLALAQMYHDCEQWSECYDHAKRALDIIQHPMDYSCEPEAWSWQPYDLASLGAWNMRLYAEALDLAEQAHMENPDDARLATNVRLIREFVDAKLGGA
jgi:glycosyltransferase involved in cell wall biosynthesis